MTTNRPAGAHSAPAATPETRMTTEIVKAGGALAIRPEQTDWTPAQVAVLRQSGISEDVTPAEMSGFLHLCQRTQLDPFSRQIYLIGRKDKRAGRTVFTPQTGIDGYRVIAHRVVAESRENFGYEDTLWCDSSGRWRDVWLLNEPPAAVKVTVVRNGHRFPAIALYREYVQTGWENKPTGLWGKMPAGQLAKCAEALALRKAFPHDLAGVYTAEEMAQADNPASTDQQPGVVRQLRPQIDEEAPARDFLREAYGAPDADTVRQIWLDAKAGGAARVYLDRIAQVGREKAAAAEVVDGEVVEPEQDEHTAALDDLRAAAMAAGVADTVENDFTQSYGVTTADATPEKLREMAALLRGAA